MTEGQLIKAISIRGEVSENRAAEIAEAYIAQGIVESDPVETFTMVDAHWLNRETIRGFRPASEIVIVNNTNLDVQLFQPYFMAFAYGAEINEDIADAISLEIVEEEDFRKIIVNFI